MPHTTVHVPRIRIASRLEDVELAVQGSLLLSLPGSPRSPSTSSELLKQVTEEHLWICRKGSCHFSIAISVAGEPVTGNDKEVRLTEWIGECEVWGRVGLQLQYCGTSRMESSGEMIFSIQHPDLSSALVAPSGTPTAEFRSLSCCIDIFTTTTPRAADKRGQKRRKTEQVQTETEELSEAPSQHDDYYYRCLTPADRKAVDDFVLSMNLGSRAGREEPGASRQERESTTLVERVMSSDNTRGLIQSALEILVWGRKGPCKAVTVLESTPSHSLANLVPAVFHIPYLKAVSDRAKLLPVIATSLARMRNAESPSLRQAVESFQVSTPAPVDDDESPGPQTQMDQIITGIERSA